MIKKCKILCVLGFFFGSACFFSDFSIKKAEDEIKKNVSQQLFEINSMGASRNITIGDIERVQIRNCADADENTKVCFTFITFKDFNGSLKEMERPIPFVFKKEKDAWRLHLVQKKRGAKETAPRHKSE